MVIWGEAPEQAMASGVVARADLQPSSLLATQSEPEISLVSDESAAQTAQNGTITLANGEVLEISAFIRPSDVAEGSVVSLRLEQAPLPAEAPLPEEVSVAVAPDQEFITVYVTGSSVNMRSGPTTADAVVAAVGNGAMMQLIEELGNGWSHIRDLTTGQTGYMASRFLSPDQI